MVTMNRNGAKALLQFLRGERLPGYPSRMPDETEADVVARLAATDALEAALLTATP